MGCIHKFRVGRRAVEFTSRDSFVTSVKEVFQCPVVGSPFHHRFTTTPMYDSDDKIFSEFYGGAISSKGDNNDKVKEETETVSFCSIRNPCHHHGHCWDDMGLPSGYRCVCLPEFSGEFRM